MTAWISAIADYFADLRPVSGGYRRAFCVAGLAGTATATPRPEPTWSGTLTESMLSIVLQ